MKVLGIDPGLLNTGYGVVEDNGNGIKLITAGCITNKSKDKIDKRFSKIYNGLKNIIREANPEVVALENVIFCNNTKIAIKLGEARGVAILTAVESGIPIAEYAPKKIKQAVVGRGNASKQQVQGMVKQLLGLKELPSPDVADALAVAICHLNQEKQRQAVALRISSESSSGVH